MVLALLLDFFLTPNWAQAKDTAAIVLTLVALCVLVTLCIVGYVIYRLKLRLWAGPQTISGNAVTVAADGQLYFVDINPPSYEHVMLETDLDLPTYESIAGDVMMVHQVVAAGDCEKGIILHM